jgi:response regulator RpfG family c-di-GMP phosphodiesterase
MAQMTFIIADDHPLFRGAMRQALEGIDANIEILEAGDLESARKKAGDHPEADLILLDLTMPGVSGLSGLIAFRAEFSSLPVVVVSATDDVKPCAGRWNSAPPASFPNPPASMKSAKACAPFSVAGSGRRPTSIWGPSTIRRSPA